MLLLVHHSLQHTKKSALVSGNETNCSSHYIMGASAVVAERRSFYKWFIRIYKNDDAQRKTIHASEDLHTESFPPIEFTKMMMAKMMMAQRKTIHAGEDLHIEFSAH